MITILDVEITVSNSGNPFDKTNKLCYIGVKSTDFQYLYDIEFSSTPFKEDLTLTQGCLDMTELLVGFNIKFDLHWLRRYGLDFSKSKVWDCQIVHFILTGQKETYPSLNDVAEYYGLPQKLDEVKELYWNEGIDTTKVPKDLLEEYLAHDLWLTEQVYLKQYEEIKSNPKLRTLCNLHCLDLLVLEEMEFNGILFDTEECTLLGDKVERDIKLLQDSVHEFHGRDDINLASNDHLSAFLYGGSFTNKRRVSRGTFKTGSRKGQPKTGWEEYEVTLPRLIKPIKGSALKKEGFYSTAEDTLRSLKGSKRALEIIELLLSLATKQKLLGTYYRGLVKLNETMNWEPNIIHGTLNQCVARTGRLSSSKPNLQNFDGGIKVLFYSRYK